MIATLLKISWTNLKRDRVAQMLAFLLPLMFFTIFALVFGSQSNTSTARIRVAVVDEDNSDLSRRIVEGLRNEKGLRARTTMDESGTGETLNRSSAEQFVRDGDVPIAIVLPKGLGEGAAAFGRPSNAPHVQLLADVSDRVAPQMVYGLLQKVAMTSAPDILMKGGFSQFERYAGALTPEQRTAVNGWLSQLTPAASAHPASSAANGVFGLGVDTVDVMRQQGNRESLISFYAAGIGVMFLLFSMSGASGALLEEVDSGTLDRVLSTRVGMSGLLAGKWLFLTLMGIGQLSLMFLWGRVAFGLDLFHHVPGFVIMTAFTAAAAAGFGLVLATAARTRAQLSGMSTIIILIMSSVGGSMFPRFLMSDTMQKMGLVTFNAWALDGYLKVFWRNAPIVALWPQLLVLTGLTAFFLGIARTLARRWEAA